MPSFCGNKRMADAPIETMSKTRLITGASSGIGKATAARLLAGMGWNVLATMRDPEAGRDRPALGQLLVTCLDVQDHASIAGAIDAAATDGSDRLRYLVGDGARGFIRAWDTQPSEDCVVFMRPLFSQGAEGRL
jgi:NAD(P)-dependent dehydrogenase (short-subunit alcohol dehydrogenase family)